MFILKCFLKKRYFKVKRYLLGKIIEFIKNWHLLNGGEGVLLALSGGPDSVFMTEMFSDLSRIFNLRFECVHINHGIRGEEAQRDEEFVREYCLKKGYNLVVRRISGIKEGESGVEERARKKRYDILEKVRKERKLDLIATAHTLDDCIETVLFNLIRGAGISGISGIPPRYGNIIRPILSIERDEIERYLGERRIAYVIDSTNMDTRYTRNYIRKILPLFANINPDFKKHIFQTAIILRGAAQWSKRQVNIIKSKEIHHSEFAHVYNVGGIDLPDLVFVQLLKLYIPSPSYNEVSQFLQLIKKGSGKIVLRNIEVSIGNNELAFSFKRYMLNRVFTSVEDIEENKEFNYTVSIKEGKARGNMECQIDESFFPFVMRTRKEGDRISGKKLKDRFIDLKIPYWKRNMWPVFEKNGKIFFVPGIFKDEKKDGNLKLEVKKYARGRFSIFD